MSDDHDCPGLSECENHPRWYVVKVLDWWFSFPPGSELSEPPFPSYAAAITYATKQAQKETTP